MFLFYLARQPPLEKMWCPDKKYFFFPFIVLINLPEGYLKDEWQLPVKKTFGQIRQLNDCAVWHEIPIFNSIITKVHHQLQTGMWLSCESPELAPAREFTWGTRLRKKRKRHLGFWWNAQAGSIYTELEWLSWNSVVSIDVLHTP